MLRQIFLDTETTGLEIRDGHRIIEIGCVEMIDRKLTKNNYHQYIRPDRESDEEALQVHGITTEFLKDKPRFAEIVDEFLDYIRGAELIIHNATFDVGFLDHELNLAAHTVQKVSKICDISDSLDLARQLHPGQRNSLDALCKRYEIKNEHRVLHGALLDSEILADVYLAMTGGQTALLLGVEDNNNNADEMVSFTRLDANRPKLRIITANKDELAAHQKLINEIQDESNKTLWY